MSKEAAFYQVKMNDLLVKYRNAGHVFRTHHNPRGVGLELDSKYYHQLVHAEAEFCRDDFERLEAFLKKNTEEKA